MRGSVDNGEGLTCSVVGVGAGFSVSFSAVISFLGGSLSAMALLQEQEHQQKEESVVFPQTEPQFRRLRRFLPPRRKSPTSALRGNTAAHSTTQAITAIPAVISFFI